MNSNNRIRFVHRKKGNKTFSVYARPKRCIELKDPDKRIENMEVGDTLDVFTKKGDFS